MGTRKEGRIKQQVIGLKREELRLQSGETGKKKGFTHQANISTRGKRIDFQYREKRGPSQVQGGEEGTGRKVFGAFPRRRTAQQQKGVNTSHQW